MKIIWVSQGIFQMAAAAMASGCSTPTVKGVQSQAGASSELPSGGSKTDQEESNVVTDWLSFLKLGDYSKVWILHSDRFSYIKYLHIHQNFTFVLEPQTNPTMIVSEKMRMKWCHSLVHIKSQNYDVTLSKNSLAQQRLKSLLLSELRCTYVGPWPHCRRAMDAGISVRQ